MRVTTSPSLILPNFLITTISLDGIAEGLSVGDIEWPEMDVIDTHSEET